MTGTYGSKYRSLTEIPKKTQWKRTVNFRIKSSVELELKEQIKLYKRLETQDHILFYPSYSELRQDLDVHCDKNLGDYVRDVMQLHDKIKKK